MVVRNILVWPNPKLRVVSEEFIAFDSEAVKLLALDLKDTMKTQFGLGLAAPQVGVNKQMVVVDSNHVSSLEEDSELSGVVVLINPKVSHSNPGLISSAESCLSVPGLAAEVKRHAMIDVNYLNLKGEVISRTLTGRDACILQHEIDHLSGKLFVDRLSPMRKKMVISKLKKIEKRKQLLLKDEKKSSKQSILTKRAKLRAERKKKNKSRRKNR